MSLTRISMTIPGDVLRRADRLARALDRSRSWVLAEGVRRLETGTARAEPRGAAPRLDSYRSQQLAADRALSTEERVLAAERTAREVPVRSFGRLFITFDRPEDWLHWKQLEAVGQV
jgi:hypothetical protein